MAIRRKIKSKNELATAVDNCEAEQTKTQQIRDNIRNSQPFERFMNSHRVQQLSLKATTRLLKTNFFQNEQELLIQEINLPAPRLGITICLFGDLHADTQTMPVEKIAELKQVLCDLASDYSLAFYAFVGDLINDYQEDMIGAASYLMQGLPAPCYAVLGNHDHNGYSKEIIAALITNGVCVLNNQHLKVDDYYIAGVDSWWKGRHDIDKALDGLSEKDLERTIILGHEPVLGTMHECYLHLAGHSHAGQVAVPRKNPILFPPGSKPFTRGLYDVDGNRYVYTTAGLGTSAFPLRVFAPPEITILSI